MLYIDKYIDRNPDVQAAGKLLKSVENIRDSLNHYSIEEKAFNIVNSKYKKLHKIVPDTESLGYSQFLPKESLKDLLSPELRKSRFVAFKEKFSEDMYFKKAELGKALELASKPREYNNENFIYGLKNKKEEKLYELVFPNKTTNEINKEFLKWHDKYLISHKSYLPSERIQRNYNENFESHTVFGISTSADKTGEMVKTCLQHCDRVVVVNKAQKKFQTRTNGQLGKKVVRCDLNLSNNQTFGIQSKNPTNFNVKALIENVEPCAKNVEIIEALSHINNLRRLLFNRSDFHMNDLKILFKNYDEKGTGYVKFHIIMKALRSLQIHANGQKIRTLISHFQLFKDGNELSDELSTEDFWKLLHIQYPLPRHVNATQPNKICSHKQTTYRLLCSDHDKSIIEPQKKPRILTEYDRTTAGDLIVPDVPMHYGLCSRDFEVLRSKEELNIIFKYLLSHNFDQVWTFACTGKVCESSCKMSVNAFRNYLNEYNSHL